VSGVRACVRAFVRACVSRWNYSYGSQITNLKDSKTKIQWFALFVSWLSFM